MRLVRPSGGGAAFADDRLRPLFARLDPERHVRFEIVPLDVGATPAERATRYAAAVAGLPPADGPDLVLCAEDDVGALGRADVLLDLGPPLRGERWFRQDDFRPGSLRAGQVRGKQVALPLEAFVEVARRNRRVFEEAGVGAPAPGWSWDDFVATARTLTRPGRWGCYVSPFWPSLPTVAWQHEADLLTPDGARLVLNEPGTSRGMELLAA